MTATATVAGTAGVQVGQEALSGITATATRTMRFPVDPGGSYAVTATLGTGATATVSKWVEVDC